MKKRYDSLYTQRERFLLIQKRKEQAEAERKLALQRSEERRRLLRLKEAEIQRQKAHDLLIRENKKYLNHLYNSVSKELQREQQIKEEVYLPLKAFIESQFQRKILLEQQRVQEQARLREIELEEQK